MHATLVAIDDQQSALFLSLPALCADSLSLAILIRELGGLYSGKQLMPVGDLRYVQFAQWQDDLLQAQEDAAVEGRAFWKPNALPDASELSLPFEVKSLDASRFDEGRTFISDLQVTNGITALQRLTGVGRLTCFSLPGKVFYPDWLEAPRSPRVSFSMIGATKN